MGNVGRWLEQTIAFWQHWSCAHDYKGPWSDLVLRSALALKLMIFAPSGGSVASPTTSLPERIGGQRNWDYRYCWIRDSIFTVWALASVGAEAEAEGVRRFIQR